MGLGNLGSSLGMAHGKSRSVNKTNWKVKVHSIIEEKNPEVLLRLSHQAGATEFRFGYHTAQNGGETRQTG
jgi:hypothetical protein